MLRRLTPGDWIGIAALLFAAVVWFVRLEGRVDRTELVNENQQKAIENAASAESEVHKEIREDLLYIRRRLDHWTQEPPLRETGNR